ncbi:MAG: hypothetical protein Q4D16_03490 [Eubacteriales bacterium]|nr:hypothetical protein [Eubacteriales bacterium]
MLKMNLQTFADAVTGKIDRKYMAHLIDASFGGSSATWVRLGKDLEEYNVELNPDVESTKNILGETAFKHNGYEVSSEADPFYAEVGDKLFEKLQEIVDTLAKDDTCKTKALEVHMWDGDESTGFVAYQQYCYIVPASYGGDTSGYQIPFTVHYVGSKTKGKYVASTKTFTADGSTPVS